MFKRIVERLVARKPISWEIMVGNGLICLLLMFQISLWIPVAISTLTGAMLIVHGLLWIMQGIYPLFLENRPTSATVGCAGIIISGCCIIGLGIAMIVPLMAEVDWVPRMAGIFYSLAFFAWLFVMLKMAPIITQWLLIGVGFCVIATGYAFVCNVLVVINALVTDVSHIAAHWEQAIGYILSGGAIVGWTLCVMWKTTIPANLRKLVPAFMIFGVVYIGLGIVLTTALMSC